MIDGMIRLMNASDFLTFPINFGNPVEFTISQLAEQVIKLTDSKSKIVFKPLPQDDPLQRKPSIELAIRKIGWEPKVQLEEGLVKTIDYFKKDILEN